MSDHLVGKPFAVLDLDVGLPLAKEFEQRRFLIEHLSDAVSEHLISGLKPFDRGIKIWPASFAEREGGGSMPSNAYNLPAIAERTAPMVLGATDIGGIF